MSLGGIYGSQIKSGHFNLSNSLFGIPFVLGTLLLGSQTLMATMGRITVVREGDEGFIFTGVGFLGWKRRFRWLDVVSITETIGTSRFGYTARPGNTQIAMKTTHDGVPKTILFGGLLSMDRKEFILSVVRSQLRH